MVISRCAWREIAVEMLSRIKTGKGPGRAGRRRSGLALAVMAVVLMMAAQSAAAGGHGEESVARVSGLIFPAINFALFVYILRRFGASAISGYLQRRRSEIVASLEAAAAANREAEEEHSRAQAHLGRSVEDAARLEADMRSAAAGERTRRLKLAADTAERIVAGAHLVAEQEMRSGREALRREIVEAAVGETLILLRRQIKGPDLERFVGEFARDVQARV